MRDYEELLEQIERMIHKYNQKENRKLMYGADTLLTQTEVHILASIGEEPGIGVKKLAQLKGVTDGAISQMIRKLVEKALVTKRVSQESEAKIELTLTQKGQVCFAEHQKYHLERNKKWCNLLDELSDGSYKDMVRLFQNMEEELDQ